MKDEGKWLRYVFSPDENRRLIENVFLRCIAFVYFCAFISLWTQVRGLAGSHGILPLSDFLAAVRAQLAGLEKYHAIPTLCWFNSSDASLFTQCGLGTALSVLLMAGFLPRLALVGLWLLWLSLTVACRDFLGFQWENLLLESGLLAIFFAPWSLSLKRSPPPPRLMIWLLWWLLFRLMFLSGMVKLLSGDPAWRNFTALSYHYETQPLPTVFGWYAHHLPAWAHVIEMILMYGIELLMPFLIFAGRRGRIASAIGFVLLQTAIAITGNYCYFNLLTAILCIPLLDDKLLMRLLRPKALSGQKDAEPATPIIVSIRRQLGPVLFATGILLVSTVQTAGALQLISRAPPVLGALLGLVEPFRSVNTYGLFAVMTKTRPEIIIEGSNDANTWLPYEFRYKPGDLKRRPKFVAPHQPRLDWQMWFAALSNYRQNPWFVNFCVRVLQGEPEVLALLEKNPFPDQPPKYLRATLYNYTFTDRSTLRETGEWWKREYLGPYFGPISLKNESVGPKQGVQAL